MQSGSPGFNILYPFAEVFLPQKRLTSELRSGTVSPGGYVGQITANLGRAQPIAYDKTLIHHKTKVIRLKRNAASRLLVQQSCQLYAGSAPAGQVAHEKLSSDAGLHQGLYQKDVM